MAENQQTRGLIKHWWSLGITWEIVSIPDWFAIAFGVVFPIITVVCVICFLD